MPHWPHDVLEPATIHEFVCGMLAVHEHSYPGTTQERWLRACGKANAGRAEPPRTGPFVPRQGPPDSDWLQRRNPTALIAMTSEKDHRAALP